eukprot:497276-Amorphochlora_amoeboformis.AAC.1
MYMYIQSHTCTIAETYVSPCYLFLTSAGDTLSFDTAQLNMTNGSAESGQSQLKASDEILYVF